MIYKTKEEIPAHLKGHAFQFGDEFVITSIGNINKAMDVFVRSPAFKALKQTTSPREGESAVQA